MKFPMEKSAAVHASSSTLLYNNKGQVLKNRTLAVSSAWVIGKYIVNKDGHLFAQVSISPLFLPSII